MKYRGRGFTLVELLVVISIIALLSSVVLASLNAAREKGRVAALAQFDANVKHGIGAELVGEWTFDDPSRPWVDTSGFGHDGSPFEAAASPSGGFNGLGAAFFDGVNDSLTLAGSGSAFFPMPSFTICAWTKTPGLAPGMGLNGIFSLTYGLTISIDVSGSFRSYITNGTTNIAVVTPANLLDDRFHHLCVSADSETRKHYVDGALATSQPVPWPGMYPGGGFVGLGLETNYPSMRRFNGLIDDVRIYSSTLTASEVGALYAEGAVRRGIAIQDR